MDTLDKNASTIENAYQSQKITTKPLEIITKKDENITAISSSKQPAYIRKKLVFNKFVKLVKKGGYTSAKLISKSLGIDKGTILSWTNHPKVRQALSVDVHQYVSTIKRNKDWKAQAYLLDKVLDDKQQEDKAIDLKQLIVINTK